MATGKSTKGSRPGKPSPDFPLFAHSCGYWAKQIRGRRYYFGKWADDPKGKAALRRYNAQRADLEAGRKPRAYRSDGFSCRDAANHFLTAKEARVRTGDITQRHWDDLKRACDRIIETFGRPRQVEDLRPEDFRRLYEKMAERYSATSLLREIGNVRAVFKWCFENAKIDRPVQFGTEFKAPSKKQQRLARHALGNRAFTAEQLNAILNAAGMPLRAMVLLGVNCGLGNHDIAFMQFRHVDLERGWLDYPRQKTGIDRRAKLWPETVNAIRQSLETRRQPRNRKYQALVFVTKYRQPWGRDDDKRADPIGYEFRKVTKELGIHRRGLTFYSLRHTFRTIAAQAKDPPACDFIMGHAEAEGRLSSRYTQFIEDARLEAVAEFVRAWLWEGRDHG